MGKTKKEKILQELDCVYNLTKNNYKSAHKVIGELIKEAIIKINTGAIIIDSPKLVPAIPVKLTELEFRKHLAAFFKSKNADEYSEALDFQRRDAKYDSDKKKTAAKIKCKNEDEYAVTDEGFKEFDLRHYMRNLQDIDVDFENNEIEDFFEDDKYSAILCSANGDWEEPVFFFLYFYKTEGKINPIPNTYVPIDGNFWNSETREAYSDGNFPEGYNGQGFDYDNDKMWKEFQTKAATLTIEVDS